MSRQMKGVSMSEFGKGFTYCLGLFLAHTERYSHLNEANKSRCASLWLNDATEHLLEFDAEHAPESLRDRCISFQNKCVFFRNNCFAEEESPAWDDVKCVLQEAKDILLEYDRLNGFKVEKGEYE